jgi:hypothetical protein
MASSDTPDIIPMIRERPRLRIALTRADSATPMSRWGRIRCTGTWRFEQLEISDATPFIFSKYGAARPRSRDGSQRADAQLPMDSYISKFRLE